MNKQENYDVAIIGAGPTGIAAALKLKKLGVTSVILLDRESNGGGIPRHCGHPPFGIRELYRPMSGPNYAKEITKKAINENVNISLKSSVIKIEQGGLIDVVSPDKGLWQIKAKRVLIATGTRETPRSARLVSGTRALGICNTGALQSMVYLKKRIPFKRPVIVGTEIVSFSALLTCRNAGIKPVAILEENSKPSVPWPMHYATKFFNVPLYMQTKIVKIEGQDRVSSLVISDGKNQERTLECDGILFTGEFTPDSTLARMGHLKLDENGKPLVDGSGRCSDPTYYSAGNIMHRPVKVAGKCWSAGNKIANTIAKDLANC